MRAATEAQTSMPCLPSPAPSPPVVRNLRQGRRKGWRSGQKPRWAQGPGCVLWVVGSHGKVEVRTPSAPTYSAERAKPSAAALRMGGGCGEHTCQKRVWGTCSETIEQSWLELRGPRTQPAVNLHPRFLVQGQAATQGGSKGGFPGEAPHPSSSSHQRCSPGCLPPVCVI